MMEGSPPDDPCATAVVIGGYKDKRAPILLLNALNQDTSLLLGRIHVGARFTEIGSIGDVLTVCVFNKTTNQGRDSLTPVRFLWHTEKNSIHRTLLQELDSSGQPCPLSQKRSLQYDGAVCMTRQSIVRDEKIPAPLQHAKRGD
jgi:hypothetical protein